MATTILYAHSASIIGGGNKVLLSLIAHLDRSRFRPVSVIPDAGPLEADLRRLDVPYTVLDLRPKSRTGWAATNTVMRLAAACLRVRARLVHANDPFVYRLASGAAKLCRAARVCHVHHPGVTRDLLAWTCRIPPRLVVTPSLFMKRELELFLPAARRIRLEAVWNPIDTDWFRPSDDVRGLKARLGLDPHGRHICIMAGVSPHKGHVCFLRAAALILRRFPATTFHVVGSPRPGDEAYAVSLHALADELGIADRIRFWGFVSDEVARDVVSASDLFILPTREEGFGLSPGEAQACEVPVLTSDLAPLREVVDHGRTGYLLQPDDHEQFARRAIELLCDHGARRAMGATGRAWVVARFSPRAHAGRMMALYDAVLPRRRPAAVAAPGRDRAVMPAFETTSPSEIKYAAVYGSRD